MPRGPRQAPARLPRRAGAPRTALGAGARPAGLSPPASSLIAERGATAAACPVSNMKLANGRAMPYLGARAAGVPMGLGTDGTSSNNNLDMFEQMKFFSLLQKHTGDDPAVAPATEVLELARGYGAPILGPTRLEVEARADFLLVRHDLPETSVGDVDADLVYAATGEVVDTTVVDGRILMRGREVEGMAEVVGEVRERARRLTA
ncbi:MAG: amidohydrolase family protein [Acidimicrobiia bacterium]|nr:amidohydrolase family protein [Acidimicrobiia bacterium]